MIAIGRLLVFFQVIVDVKILVVDQLRSEQPNSHTLAGLGMPLTSRKGDHDEHVDAAAQHWAGNVYRQILS